MTSPHRLIIGLGNPGDQYIGTRHNLGIDVVQRWVVENSPSATWQLETKFEALIVRGRVGETSVTCLYPQTYMNDSGRAVQAYVAFYQLAIPNLLVVHDDIEVSLGDVVLAEGGSARGHKGVRSIQQALDTRDIARVRLGVGRPPAGVGVDQFVLQRFVPQQEAAIAQLQQQALPMITAWVTGHVN